MIAMLAAKTTHTPLYPKKRNTHKEKTNKIWNNEGAPTIVNGLNWETKKVS
jgi:hypothetical protein